MITLKRLIVIFVVIILLLSLPCYLFSKHHSAAFDSYVENGIKGDVSKEINTYLVEKLNNKYSEEFINIHRKSEGSIDYISLDTNKINIFANELSYEIYDNITLNKNKFSIPIGNALGIKLLSEKGPTISFSVFHENFVSYKIKSEVVSGGINQTLHRVSIEFKTDIKCVAPFYDKSTEIITSVVISEILIVGKVPEIITSPTRS